MSLDQFSLHGLVKYFPLNPTIDISIHNLWYFNPQFFIGVISNQKIKIIPFIHHWFYLSLLFLALISKKKMLCFKANFLIKYIFVWMIIIIIIIIIGKKKKATLPSHMSIFILSFKQDFIVLRRSCTYWIQALSSWT